MRVVLLLFGYKAEGLVGWCFRGFVLAFFVGLRCAAFILVYFAVLIGCLLVF